MAEKNIDAKIEEKEKELEELKAKRAIPVAQEYPKMIPDPNDPSQRIVVNSADEEKRHAGTVVKAFDKTPEEQEAEREARLDADKEAAGAKSRLAGPESKPAKAGKGKK